MNQGRCPTQTDSSHSTQPAASALCEVWPSRAWRVSLLLLGCRASKVPTCGCTTVCHKLRCAARRHTTSSLLSQAVQPPALRKRHRQQPKRLCPVGDPRAGGRRVGVIRSAYGPTGSCYQPVGSGTPLSVVPQRRAKSSWDFGGGNSTDSRSNPISLRFRERANTTKAVAKGCA